MGSTDPAVRFRTPLHKSGHFSRQVLRGDRSATLVSLQRFHGKLGGREGSFVLQGSETVEDGKIKAKSSVVHRFSGTRATRKNWDCFLCPSVSRGKPQAPYYL